MRVSVMRWAVVGLALVLGAPLAGQTSAPAMSGAAPAGQAPAGAVRAERPLERLVSLDLQDVPLGDALKEINRQARLGLTYAARVVDVRRRVTVRAAKMTAGAALERVLDGTGAQAKETPAGTVVLVEREEPKETSARPATGVIYGQVTDTADGRRVAGAQVLVQHTGLAAMTNDSGFYAIRDVPVGPQTVVARLIGYRPVAQVVTVADSQPVRVDFALAPSPTRLTEIVTTATGDRRRLELGNDITVIDADSIVRTQPITSVTDLLEGRVPGLVVQRTSGAPGDPSRLRLRGAGSPQLNNDPIVIVDGIRIYSAQSDSRSANLATSGSPAESQYAAPSPLDNLDPHSIERVEVLKGPSAATLYGQDAANGVIVITTKRGREGPARWRVSAERGRSVTPGRYPDMYLRWGRRLDDGRNVMCPISNLEPATHTACQADSLVHFQLLNDPALSIVAPGQRSAASVGVSGGSGALTYAVTGSYSDEVGQARLPQFEVERFRARHGAAPPAWMERPQELTQWGVTSGITARLGPTAEVVLSTQLSRTRQQRSALEQQLGSFMTTYLDRSTGAYYSANIDGIHAADEPLTAYYERATATGTQFTNGVTLTWKPLRWLTTEATGGLNLIHRSDQVFLPRGVSPGRDSIGRFALGQGTSVVSTANVRANAEFPLTLGFQLRLATGVNYTGRSTADLTGRVEGLAEGTSSPNQAARINSLSERRDDAATFGWYVEPSLNHRRLWFSTGLRFDGGSTYGSRLTLPTFPKLSLSYLISDEPFFPAPLRSVFNTLRLRAGYGHASRQPGPVDRLRLFDAPEPVWNDDRFVDGLDLVELGNTQLRPERTKELELGFDADLLDDRLSLSVSGYRKTTADALLKVPVAPSVYGEAVSVWRNIGVVRNEGVELMLGTNLLRGDAVTLSTQLLVSHNRNTVVELGRGVAPFNLSGSQRVAPGYPLFGRWAQPILGYDDADGDGVLEASEIVAGDTAVYVGATTPDYTANLHATLGLLRGALTISADVAYEDGVSQMNQVMSHMVYLSRGRHDPSAPLRDQMLFVASAEANLEYALMQTVSTLRLNSVAVSFAVPAALARRLGARALSVALQGTNLALRTNYAGLDPSVNGHATGNSIVDTGVMPQPRTWQVRVNASY